MPLLSPRGFEHFADLSMSTASNTDRISLMTNVNVYVEKRRRVFRFSTSIPTYIHHIHNVCFSSICDLTLLPIYIQ